MVDKIKHRSHVATPDNPDFPVSSAKWNASHVGPTVTDGVTPVDDVHQIEVIGGGAAGVAVTDLGNHRVQISHNDSVRRDADQIDYDHTGSGLTAVDVQAGLDEAVTRLPTQNEKAALDGSPVGLSGANPVASQSDLAETFWTYDFATDGGGQGTFVLHGPPVPDKTFVNAAFLQIITPFASDGLAQVALSTGEVAGDIAVAAAFGAVGYGAGIHRISVNKLTTGSRMPVIVITGADLTDGKIKVSLDRIEGWG